MDMLRLTQERIRREWTQDDVAKKVGATKQSVCDWEKCRSFPRRPVLLKLERLFGLSHRELFAPANDDDHFSSTN